MNIFSRIWNEISDLLFPYVCYGCGTEGALFCPLCTERLLFVLPACFVCKKLTPLAPGKTCRLCRRVSNISRFVSPFSFHDPVIRESIHSLKYQKVRKTAPFFAEFLFKYMRRYGIEFPSGAVVIPTPLHPTRERVRGFNQSALIARSFVEQFSDSGMRYEENVLTRNKKTAPQVGLPKEERINNMAHAFSVRDAAPIRGATVVLVDDVATTGATLEEAARVVREAGAKRVWAITVAH